MMTHRITLFLSFLLVVLVNMPKYTHAQNTLLQEVVNKAATKIADGKTYSYSFKSYAKGKLAQVFPVTTGQVSVVLKKADYSGAMHKARIKAQDPRGATNVVINQGIVYSILAHKQKVYRAPRYRTASDLFNEQVLLPVYSLKDLKNAPKKQGKLLPEGSFRGNPCQIVNVMSEGKLSLSFWLGKQDHLIHKIEATTPAYAGSTLVMEFGNVSTGTKVDEAFYTFELPKGYVIEEYSGKYPAIGSVATNWTVTNYNGKPVKLADLKGKVVLIDFWATWCRPCLQAMPHLQKLADKYKAQGLAVIGLTAMEKGNPKAMAKKLNIDYTIADGATVAKQYKITGLPFALVIGRNGKVVDFFNGYLGSETDAMMEKVVKKALGTKF